MAAEGARQANGHRSEVASASMQVSSGRRRAFSYLDRIALAAAFVIRRAHVVPCEDAARAIVAEEGSRVCNDRAKLVSLYPCASMLGAGYCLFATLRSGRQRSLAGTARVSSTSRRAIAAATWRWRTWTDAPRLT